LPFDNETAKTIRAYATAHIPDEAWHLSFFDFINEPRLSLRLGEEFLSTRIIYKILEGIEAIDWLKRAQIRLQILSYASIYEAVIHHFLFSELAEDEDVKELTRVKITKKISIPRDSVAVLNKHLKHDGKIIVPIYEEFGTRDETKVRFDAKANCAFKLGLIEEKLKDELIEFYEARNSIHIHAEIRKEINYELELSMQAYRRLVPFKDQIMRWQSARLLPPPA
jgi:hypothetical protein